jgi:hypothetical protein
MAWVAIDYKDGFSFGVMTGNDSTWFAVPSADLPADLILVEKILVLSS